MTPRTLAAIAPLLASLAPAGALAQDRVAVAALGAPTELRFTGRSLAGDVAKLAQKQRGLVVLGPEEVERKLGREAGRQLAECGASAPCLVALARRLDVDRVVGGSLDREGDAYRVMLVHADARTGDLLASWERVVPVASRKLASEVQGAAPGLLRGRPGAAAAPR